MGLLRVAAVAQIFDDVGLCVGNRDQDFARPFLSEVRRAHHDRGKWLGVCGHIRNACSGHEGLTCSALAHDLDRIVICEVLHASHDGEFLRRQRLTHQAQQLGRGRVIGSMQRRVGLDDPAPEFVGVGAEICGDVGYVLMLHETPFLWGALRIDAHITCILGWFQIHSKESA